MQTRAGDVSPNVLIVGRQRHRCVDRLALYFLDPVPRHAGRFQETSGTATSEEYDKVSHGDVQSMTSHSGSPNETGHKSDDNNGNSEAPLALFGFVYGIRPCICLSLAKPPSPPLPPRLKKLICPLPLSMLYALYLLWACVSLLCIFSCRAKLHCLWHSTVDLQEPGWTFV